MQTIYSSGQIRLNSLRRSLDVIKDAERQLSNFSARPATPATLASRIHLCNTLLNEISGIRRCLVGLKNKHAAPDGFLTGSNATDSISINDISGAVHVPLDSSSAFVAGTCVKPVVVGACVAPSHISHRRRRSNRLRQVS